MTGAPDRLAAALADRYRIERELGQGGMATVFLAEDLKHDRKVAIKILRPQLAPNPPGAHRALVFRVASATAARSTLSTPARASLTTPRS